MTLLAESYVHHIDPYVVRISGDFGIRWYGLAYLTGFVIAWLVMRWMAKSGRVLLKPAQVADFVTAMIVGVLVGGRVGHAIFYDRSLLTTFTSTPPFWELFAIHHGGMSSHGGIIGVILACIWFGRRNGLPTWHLLDIVAFTCPAGLGLGRVANFINGELWGRPLPDSMRADPPWWSIKYPEEILSKGFDANRLVPLVDYIDPRQPLAQSIFQDAQRGRTIVIEHLAPLLTPHWPSQIFQAITDGAILPAVLVIVWWKPRVPGVVAAWFLMAYGALRFTTEQFRTPDQDVLTIAGATLPMWLSIAMIVAGLLVLATIGRRDVPRLGGLRRPSTPAT
ncbi:MAG: prolipoprotein diacylglyceryl transferase [Phycisphaerales bacterium]